MSENNASRKLSLSQLIDLSSRYYPGGLITRCHQARLWPEHPRPMPDDLLAEFMAVEIAGTWQDQAPIATQVYEVIGRIRLAVADLEKVARGLTADLVELVLCDFLAWALRHRRSVALPLFEGWLTLHEDELVRQHLQLIRARLEELAPALFTPGAPAIPPEEVEKLLASLQGSVNLPADEPAAPSVPAAPLEKTDASKKH